MWRFAYSTHILKRLQQRPEGRQWEPGSFLSSYISSFWQVMSSTTLLVTRLMLPIHVPIGPGLVPPSECPARFALTRNSPASVTRCTNHSLFSTYVPPLFFFVRYSSLPTFFASWLSATLQRQILQCSLDLYQTEKLTPTACPSSPHLFVQVSPPVINPT